MSSSRKRRLWRVLAWCALSTCGTFAIAHADLGPPRDLVRKTLDDTKKQAAHAADEPKQAVDDAKKHAKDAVDDALDGGLATDAGRVDGGDAGDAGDGGDAADSGDPVVSARELEQRRAERAAHLRELLRDELARLGVNVPIDDALRAELRDHARRTAWLDRIGALAGEQKDTASFDTVMQLLQEESARHENAVKSWVERHRH